MRTPFLAVAAMAVLGSTGAIADDTMSLNQFPHRVEPVLVQVNAQGRVTEASPAYPLPPKVNRLLRANLDEMIRKPAVDKHGKPMSSQFIMNLALQATPRTGGDYDSHFIYVSAKPVPAGSWYWVHVDGYRLALANRDERFRNQRLPVDYNRASYMRVYNRNTPPLQPVQQPVQMPTPSAIHAAPAMPAASPARTL